MHILDHVDAASLRSDVPDFRPGDTVKVHVNIIEGTRSRIQVFQGVVIGRQGEGVRETFTVRKVSFQVGVGSGGHPAEPSRAVWEGRTVSGTSQRATGVSRFSLILAALPRRSRR